MSGFIISTRLAVALCITKMIPIESRVLFSDISRRYRGVSDYKMIPVRKKLQIENSMLPGDYLMQFLVKDNESRGKESLMAQTLSFSVTKQ